MVAVPTPSHDKHALVLATLLGFATQSAPSPRYMLLPPSTCHLLSFASVVSVKNVVAGGGCCEVAKS